MEYAKRDVEAQGELYVRHVEAMTREGLHSKSDIAAELAHRDAQIAQLWKENGELRGESDPVAFPDGASMAECLDYLRLCASRWMPNARLVGNLRAGDIVRTVDAVKGKLDAVDQYGIVFGLMTESNGRETWMFNPRPGSEFEKADAALLASMSDDFGKALAVRVRVDGSAGVVIRVKTCHAYLPELAIDKILDWYAEAYAIPRDRVSAERSIPMLEYRGKI